MLMCEYVLMVLHMCYAGMYVMCANVVARGRLSSWLCHSLPYSTETGSQ